jgi:LAS superfamily LD-carboxypeptidase LdcB
LSGLAHKNMKLPVAKVVMPSCLKGQENGKLNPKLLVPCGIAKFVMVEPAARSMKALVAAAKANGIDVRSTGTYRSYEQQVALFLARYSKTEIQGRPTKKWNGTTYWQRPKTAIAAVPGTSNHGLGLAIDFAEERDGKPGVESVSDRFVRWLLKNAVTYGFSAELQSEPWHWRYVAGDKIPAAVLEYERSQQDKP